MDYENVLSFLDREYLSKSPKSGSDLSAYEDPATEAGHAELVFSVPAYENDAAKNTSQIDYAISLEDAGWEDLLAWSVYSLALSNENSVFSQNLRGLGIQNQAQVSVNTYRAKPYLDFSLHNAEPEQSAAFEEAVLKTLDQLAAGGMEKAVLNPVLKQKETSSYLTRDSGNVGVNIYPEIVNYWTHTGKLDYYEQLEAVLKALNDDSDQEILRRLADEAANAGRSALINSVPEPGLAEKLVKEQEQYLAEMKAAMNEEELAQLISDTEAFQEWNAIDASNSDFTIDPADVPDQEVYTDYTKTEGDGVSYYLAPAEAEKVGNYRLYLDLSDFTNADLMDLGLYLFLMDDLDTETYSAEELRNLREEYIYSAESKFLYPYAEDRWPMFRLSWVSLTEDFEQGLKLQLELLGRIDFTDTEKIKEVFARRINGYDLSRSENPSYIARDLAAAYTSREYALGNFVQRQ